MSAFKSVATVAVLAATIALPAVVALAADKVLARVDGTEITEADLRLAQSEIGPNINSIPEDQRLRVLVEYLVENRLLAAAAEKENLAASPDFESRLAYYRSRALRDSFFDTKIAGAVTEVEAKAVFDKQMAAVPPVEEAHARHILVEKKEEADEIVAKLKEGGDFAALAKEKSKDPGSGANGGDLGYFAKGQMVKPFEDATFALKPGEVSAPVQSQFGWHIIRLEDKRTRPMPTFESVKERIMNGLLQRKAAEVVGGLRGAAKIEYLDDELKKQIEAAQQQQQQ